MPSSFFTLIVWVDSDIFTNAFCVWWIYSSTCQSWEQKNENQRISLFSVSVNFYTVLPFIAPKPETMRTHLLQPLCFPLLITKIKCNNFSLTFPVTPSEACCLACCPSVDMRGSPPIVCPCALSLAACFDISVQFIVNAFYLPFLIFCGFFFFTSDKILQSLQIGVIW